MRQNLVERRTFSTSDFYLACYLRYMDYKIVRLDRDGQRRVFVFVDEDPDERASEILNYYNNDASVEPLAFTNTIRDLKGMLHQG
jgi:hypothetical protein